MLQATTSDTFQKLSVTSLLVTKAFIKAEEITFALQYVLPTNLC